jgi:hypothetical protein
MASTELNEPLTELDPADLADAAEDTDFSVVERGFFAAGEAGEMAESADAGEEFTGFAPRRWIARRGWRLWAAGAGCALLLGGALWGFAGGQQPVAVASPAILAAATPAPGAAAVRRPAVAAAIPAPDHPRQIVHRARHTAKKNAAKKHR